MRIFGNSYLGFYLWKKTEWGGDGNNKGEKKPRRVATEVSMHPGQRERETMRSRMRKSWCCRSGVLHQRENWARQRRASLGRSRGADTKKQRATVNIQSETTQQRQRCSVPSLWWGTCQNSSIPAHTHTRTHMQIAHTPTVTAIFCILMHPEVPRRFPSHKSARQFRAQEGDRLYRQVYATFCNVAEKKGNKSDQDTKSLKLFSYKYLTAHSHFPQPSLIDWRVYFSL